METERRKHQQEIQEIEELLTDMKEELEEATEANRQYREYTEDLKERNIAQEQEIERLNEEISKIERNRQAKDNRERKRPYVAIEIE